MCGIFGMVGNENPTKHIINGLKRLEYRGYDSSGLAVIENNQIETYKSVGRISELEKNISNREINTSIGIGHTRWATHGKVSELNAHPHLSYDKKFAVVHNGIIENASEIQKNFLNDIKMISQTDTEVISHLLSKLYNGNVIETIAKTCSLLKGSFALGILCNDDTQKIYCTASESPLVYANGNDCSFIASDISALNSNINYCVEISGGEIGEINISSIKLYDKTGNEKEINKYNIDISEYSDDKKGYEHYMMLEIMQQPEAVRNTINSFFDNKGNISILSEDLKSEKIKDFKNIIIVACGSAYHAGLVGKKAIEELCKIPCSVEIASEFRYRKPLINKNTLAIFISQSGETADTLAALRLAKKLGATTLSIVNVKSSAIDKESSNVLYTKAGREVAVATTKAYSSQLVVLYVLSIYFALSLETISKAYYNELIEELKELPQKIEESIKQTNERIKILADIFSSSNDMYFIGRQLDFAVATEASLKMKEISYIHSEAYAAGELKHGTISLVNDGTPVIVIGSDEEVFEKTISNLIEVKSRGAITVIVTDNSLKDKTNEYHYIITVPKTNKYFSASLLIPPLQLFSYYSAKNRKCDIDKPKNLAKSVTVE